MISPYRLRHRRIFYVLVLVLPVLFTASILVRKPQPITETLPSALSPPLEHYAHVVKTYDNLWANYSIQTRILSASQPENGFAIELQPLDLIAEPSLLVYWSTEQEPRVEEGSHLLGAFTGTDSVLLPLPDSAIYHTGSIFLYSLGHQRIVDKAMLKINLP